MLSQVPSVIRTFIAHQLQLLWDHTTDYPRHPSTRDVPLALIRQHTGFRFPTGQDKQALETWLRTHGAPTAPTEEDLRECAYTRCRAFGLEFPAERELQRIVRAALRGFFQDVYDRVTAQLSAPVLVPPWTRSSWWTLKRRSPCSTSSKPSRGPGCEESAAGTHQTPDPTGLLALPATALAGIPEQSVAAAEARAAHNECESRCGAHPPQYGIRC